MEDERTFDSVAAGPSKKNRSTSANTNALKLSCELLRLFVIEAIQRATTIADAEGSTRIEATHLERILPQFLLDFSGSPELEISERKKHMNKKFILNCYFTFSLTRFCG
ncbi:hypothetical protein SAY86_025237 [Trapa natans]|uniref:Centromere protein X n=1 Tax=Trapa natans TaxID=22666 RepID=A0AAN7M7Z5_TRANT|nr:hypothetical protein SAY86_025237 [Trapa natans]